MAADGELTPGELSRRVQELLLQFEALLRKIEDRYVQKETLELIREGINQTLSALKEADGSLDRSKAGVQEVANLTQDIAGLATKQELKALSDKVDLAATKAELKPVADQVTKLEGHNTWLFRVIGAFILLAVLGAVFAAGGGLAK